MQSFLKDMAYDSDHQTIAAPATAKIMMADDQKQVAVSFEWILLYQTLPQNCVGFEGDLQLPANRGKKSVN